MLDAYPGQVKIVFKHYPLPNHQMAMPAAELSVEAQRQRKFWKMHDKLFANMRQMTQENFRIWAAELGMDVERVNKALETGEHRARIAVDQQLASELGVGATPTFFVNGRVFEGAQPFEAFRARIDEELKRAQALLDAGVPMERLYDELTKPAEKAAEAEHSEGDGHDHGPPAGPTPASE